MMIKSAFIAIGLLTSHLSILAHEAPKKVQNPLTHSTSCKNLVSFFEQKYGIPSGLLAAISFLESRHSPWIFNSRGSPYRFSNKKAAVRSLETLHASGIENNHVGCMQINWPSHRRHFQNVEHLLTPYHNVEFAAKLLLKGFKRTRNWEQAIQYYHSSPSDASKAYQLRVCRAWKRFKKTPSPKVAQQIKQKIARKPGKLIPTCL